MFNKRQRRVYYVALTATAVTLFALLAGCTSSDVISAGPDTYTVTASGFGFGTAGVRETVFKKANDFCAARGLVMMPVSFVARPGEVGRGAPNAGLVFRALKPGDPELSRPHLSESEKKVDVTDDVRMSISDGRKSTDDIYAEITKLDDLRKKGLITDAEFESQKQKLLNKN